MKISDIAVPEIYRSSSDFRFFLKWFELAMERVKHDTENIVDLYDPLRCPEQLLWMLGDTVGYKYDSRLPASFNRLVLLYFMSMIRHKGSKDGVTLAAEVNLAQFNLLDYGKQSDILHNRLEDTSIPVNSVYVTPHTDEGYIEVVYFSENKPIDACLEYVRPLGMYLFDYAGVRYDGRTKVSVDARLTNSNELNTSVGPTRVGHYRREDYARMQKTKHRISTDHVTADGKVEWESEFSQIGDIWILSGTPKVKNNEISSADAGDTVESTDSDGFVWKSENKRFGWTLSKNSDGSWNMKDSNSQTVGCIADNTIGTVGSGWTFRKVNNQEGMFTLSTKHVTEEGEQVFYLASNLLESGRFRGYLKSTIDANPDIYNTRFCFYKYNEDKDAYVLINKTSDLTPSKYVIMTQSYALSVLDNSGVIVGTGTGTASVVAVQARDEQVLDYAHRRNKTYYRNSDSEQITGATLDAGYRSLYTLQLSNNEHIVKANLPTIFGLGYNPETRLSGSLSIGTHESTPATRRLTASDLFDRLPWNLAYDKTADEANTHKRSSVDGRSTIHDVSTVRDGEPSAPVPAVNPSMHSVGDAISLGQYNRPKQDNPVGINKFYTKTTVEYISDPEGLPTTVEISIHDPKNADDD